MATVVTASRTDDVATLVLDDATGLVVGEHCHVYNVGNNLDGHHVLLTVDLGTDTVTYRDNGTDVTAYNPANGILIAEVTWIDVDDVTVWLGIDSATANDTTFLTDYCVPAANDFCYRRRFNAGYYDNPTVAPSEAVKLGAVMYAAIQYRTRGSVDGYSSFDTMGTVTPIGSLGQVLQLLGCGRPQIG